MATKRRKPEQPIVIPNDVQVEGGALVQFQIAHSLYRKETIMTKDIQNGKMTPETAKTSDFNPMAMFQAFMPKSPETSANGGYPAADLFEMNQNWFNFLGRRFAQDTAWIQRLSACKSPAEMSVANAEFCKDAAADYQREFTEAIENGQQVFAQFASIGQSGADQK